MDADKKEILGDWAANAGERLDRDVLATWSELTDACPVLALSNAYAWAGPILRAWHRRLLLACQAMENPPLGLLAGFTALCDQSLMASRLLQQWAADAPESPWNSRHRVDTKGEALAAVLDSAINGNRGLKPKIGTPELFEQFLEVNGWRPHAGGASAHITALFEELGLQACLVNLYHPKELAKTLPPSAKRFKWSEQGPELAKAQQEVPGAPVRCSFIVGFTEGDDLAGRGTARITDRVIFRYHHWLGGREWTEVEVSYGKRTERIVDGLLEQEWPWYPGFVSWQVSGTTLKLNFAPRRVIRKLARDLGYRYFLLSGVGIGSGIRERSVAKGAFVDQLRCLAESGVGVHYEFSGKPEEGSRIKEFWTKFGKVIASAGINDAELQNYTTLVDCSFAESPFAQDTGNAREIYRRYKQAQFLATELGLRRLYVHGNDVDLILVKNGCPGLMAREVLADLYAKGMVVLALLQRKFPDTWEQKAHAMQAKFPRSAFAALLELAGTMQLREGLTRDEAWKMAQHGYWVPRKQDQYSVGVVPVFWPESSLKGIDTTGAGDMTSALSLLLAGP